MIRLAEQKDLQAINEIYNQGIQIRATGDIIPVTMDQRHTWWALHDASRHPVFVMESDGEIAGWVSLSAYRHGRLALRFTSEISYYIHDDHKGKGIGTALVLYAVEQASALGFTNLIAIILEKNTASIGLMKKTGFFAVFLK